MESHDVTWEHQSALVTVVENRVIREEVLNDVVTGLQAHPASHLAPFSRISILLSIKQWEEMNLPSYNTALLYKVLHFIKFDAFMIRSSMHLELLLSFKGFATLRTRHFEGGLKSYILVSIYLGLLGVVFTVLFLADFMLNGLSVLFVQFLA